MTRVQTAGRAAARRWKPAETDNRRLANLCGALDANLRQIESALDVSIRRQQGLFTVKGYAGPTDLAVAALQFFYARAHRSLGEDDIALGLISVREGLAQENPDPSRRETRAESGGGARGAAASATATGAPGDVDKGTCPGPCTGTFSRADSGDDTGTGAGADTSAGASAGASADASACGDAIAGADRGACGDVVAGADASACGDAFAGVDASACDDVDACAAVGTGAGSPHGLLSRRNAHARGVGEADEHAARATPRAGKVGGGTPATLDADRRVGAVHGAEAGAGEHRALKGLVFDETQLRRPTSAAASRPASTPPSRPATSTAASTAATQASAAPWSSKASDTRRLADGARKAQLVHAHPAPDGGAIRLITRRSDLEPRTANQRLYLQRILSHDISFGIGPAGTGKTYLAVACAVDALERDLVKRIVLTRPAVEAGERLGFLPGDLAQKVDPYLRPLYDALYDLMGFDRVNRALERQSIEIAPLAYMRGRTLTNAFIILDEAQNTTPEQIKMFLTRLGFGSRAVVTGDATQIDLPKGQASGLIAARRILTGVKGLSFTEFDSGDVIRHPLIARIVEAYERQARIDGLVD